MMKRNLILMAALLLATTLLTSCGKDKPDTSKQGLYMGIIGFNTDIQSRTIQLLNSNSKEDMKEFVNGLTMGNGTVLYHAVNTAIDKLEAITPPEDLINASIITFTDGIDQGSYALNPNYSSGNEYLNAVSRRIKNETVGGIPISAYTIGVRGSDVNETNIQTFQQNLQKLSSDPQHNVFEIESMTEVGQIFSNIAQELYSQSSSWDVTLRTPAPEPRTLIRFTFDNVQDASESHRYIEGVYLVSNGVPMLNEITYVGLQDCGRIIYPVLEGSSAVFTFNNLLTENGAQVYTSNTKHWIWNGSNWQNNSEFSPSGNTVVNEEFRSALIMLVLDCSSSLNNDFNSVKSAACQFIETLNGNTHQ